MPKANFKRDTLNVNSEKPIFREAEKMNDCMTPAKKNRRWWENLILKKKTEHQTNRNAKHVKQSRVSKLFDVEFCFDFLAAR